MCLMVWVASERPLPAVTLADPKTPDPVTGYHRIEAVAPDAKVRACFTLPCVTHVSSHQGCGCGYNSDLGNEGWILVDEVRPLLGALSEKERQEFLEEQRSRERLQHLVEQALRDGAVEVFGCWDGDEADGPLAVEAVDASWFGTRVAPITARVRYRIES